MKKKNSIRSFVVELFGGKNYFRSSIKLASTVCDENCSDLSRRMMFHVNKLVENSARENEFALVIKEMELRAPKPRYEDVPRNEYFPS